MSQKIVPLIMLVSAIGLTGCPDLVTSVNRDRALAEKLAAAEKRKAEQERQANAAAQAARKQKANEPPREMVRVEAKAGVGKRGKRLEADHVNQTIVRPVQAMIRFEQRAELDFKLKQAIDLYRAQHGELPTTHQEFMEKIVEPNRIKLPELPEEHRYIWDGEQLMVEMPKE